MYKILPYNWSFLEMQIEQLSELAFPESRGICDPPSETTVMAKDQHSGVMGTGCLSSEEAMPWTVPMP